MEELHTISWGIFYFHAFSLRGTPVWCVGSEEALWISKTELEDILAMIKLKLGDVAMTVETV